MTWRRQRLNGSNLLLRTLARNGALESIQGRRCRCSLPRPLFASSLWGVPTVAVDATSSRCDAHTRELAWTAWDGRVEAPRRTMSSPHAVSIVHTLECFLPTMSIDLLQRLSDVVPENLSAPKTLQRCTRKFIIWFELPGQTCTELLQSCAGNSNNRAAKENLDGEDSLGLAFTSYQYSERSDNYAYQYAHGYEPSN